MSEIMKTDEENSIIANIVLNGDISRLKPEEKVKYYNMFCDSLGLNSVTQPFDIIKLQGKERLYAKKECTDQLRKLNGVSIVEMKKTFDKDLYIVEVKAQDKTGKLDIATGALSIMNLKGNDLANALMKCETKAKRRVTLSICGLGILDETELEEIPEFSNETENILKEVSQSIGKEKEELPPKQTVGFSQQSDAKRMRTNILHEAKEYYDSMTEDERSFFTGVKDDRDANKPCSDEQNTTDIARMNQIIDRITNEDVSALDSDPLTPNDDVTPEFLMDGKEEKQELPPGVA